MNWELTTPALILFLSTVIVTSVALMLWRRRIWPGSTALFWLMLAVAEWSFASGLEAVSIALPAKIFWSKVEYLGAASSPAIFLIFSLEYSQYKKRLIRRDLFLIWSLPVAIILLAATNEWHHLIWTGFTPSPIPDSNLYIYHHGLGFLIYVAYIFVFVLAGTLLLIRSYLRFPKIYHQQIGIMLIGAIFPWAGSILYLFNLNPLPGLELTPISFSFTGLALAWGISRFKLFDLVPIARDTLIENLRDSVLVLDTHNRIVDMNPAALQLFDFTDPPIGRDVLEVMKPWPALADALNLKTSQSSEVSLAEWSPRFLDVQIVSLPDRKGRLVGYLVTLHDITDRKQTESSLEAKSRQLRRLATTDDLTSLYNRRHIHNVLKAEYKRSERYKSPLSIALIDVDDFKLINDGHGHACGDEVLKIIAAELRRSVREVDVPARVGGDEFLILFPHTEPCQAQNVLERLQINLEAHQDRCAKTPIRISGGITAWFPKDSPDQVLKRVDRLLYQAKQQGKNLLIIESEQQNSAQGQEAL